MATPILKLACVLLLLVFTGFGDFADGSGSEAYVTLLYGDEFLLGVRVLGKSIRDTGSSKDMVVLVSDGVSGRAKAQLKADGWIIEAISLLANPNQVHPTRFWGVYTKLKIFNLTKYKKVVYLDADTIVVKNIDDLFKCGKFCANLKHSERMNSGVMVVEPSETVFDDMMKKVNTLPSYTGGDQGFLNSYYTGFANAHLFDPDLSAEVRNSRPVPEMERLSTLYNADVGLYMLANKWMVDEEKLRVIHYTLGPLKPWDWWTAWLLKPVDVWQDVRIQLEESLPGTGGGRNPDDQFLVKIFFILPLCILFLFHYRFFLQHRDLFCMVSRSSVCDSVRHLWYKFKSSGGLPIYSAVGVSSSSIINASQQFSNGNHFKHPASLGGISIFVCFATALASLGVAFAVVPRQVIPSTGLLLVYEWTFVLFFMIFGMYLRLVYEWGRATVVQSGAFASRIGNSDNSSKGHQRQASMCDSAAWFYGLGMALLAIIAPLLPSFLGITALFAKLGLMVAGAVVLASFMTYAAEHLAIRAFLRGREDRDQPRTRNICFLC